MSAIADRLIVLCDASGRVLARNERGLETMLLRR